MLHIYIHPHKISIRAPLVGMTEDNSLNQNKLFLKVNRNQKAKKGEQYSALRKLKQETETNTLDHSSEKEKKINGNVSGFLRKCIAFTTWQGLV